MRSVNKIILVGTVALDPEVRQTKRGTTVATFPVATSRDFTSNGDKKRVTDFHRVVARGKLGEICGKHLEKGKAVYVEGMVLNRAYEHNGERRYRTEIRADEINMLSYKKNKDQEQIVISAPRPRPSGARPTYHHNITNVDQTSTAAVASQDIDEGLLRRVRDLGTYDSNGEDEDSDRARTERCWVTYVALPNGDTLDIYSGRYGTLAGSIDTASGEHRDLNIPTLDAIIRVLDEANFPHSPDED